MAYLFRYYEIEPSQEYLLRRAPVYDLFVCCSSPEERSAIGALALPANRARACSLFHYSEHHATELRSRRREQIETAMRERGIPVTPIECRFGNPEDGIRVFRASVSISCHSGVRVLVDVSTMTKPYFFLLLRLLLDDLRAQVDLLYTEPASYPRGRRREAVFTTGLLRTDAMPGYFGRLDPVKPTLLVVLLGFEGQRSLQVYRHVSPDATIAVNGFPAYKVGWEDRSLMANERFLRESGVKGSVRLAPAADPFETANQLEEIHAELANSHNLCVAPLGSKPQALGACFFGLAHDEVRLVYPFPSAYRPKPSAGNGPSWVYPLRWEDTILGVQPTRV